MRHPHVVAACSAFFILSLAGACGGKQPTRCMSSVDCLTGQVCSAGTCQTPIIDGGSGTGGGSFFLLDGGTGGGASGGMATGGGATAGGSASNCNPQNCAAGCCDMNGVCQGGTTRGACGIGGTLCVTCGPGRVCQGGVCGNPTGGGSAGGGTGGGNVTCGPNTCATGCCDINGLCVPGTTTQACGTAGRVCIGCFGSDQCSAGSCMPNMGGGSAAGGSAAGGSAGGGSAAGGSAAGGSAAGGSAAGGSAAGGSAAGGSAAGGSAAGGSAAGGSAAGGSAGGGVRVGDVCGTAETIVGGSLTSPTSVMGTTAGYTNDYSSTNQNGCIGTDGRDRVYAVSVAANARIIASIRQAASGSYDPSINLIVGPEAQCAATPRVCAAGDDLGTASAVNAVRYVNTSTMTENVYVLADAISSLDTGGAFRLDVSVDTPPQGDACESPFALMSGTPRVGEGLSSFANDYFVTSRTSGSTCVPSSASDGPDRAYSVLVGAGETLNVSVTPSVGLNTAINLHGNASECASRTCITSSNNGPTGMMDTLIWSNTGTTARTVFVVVETPAGATGSYSITTTTGTLPGDVCSTTTGPITAAGTITGQSLAGYSVDYAQANPSNGCENYSGPDRVYSITVPPRQRLVSTVAPQTGLDPVLNLVNGTAAACNAMPRVCAATADNTFSGQTETAVWDNGTTSPQNIFLVVGGYNAGLSSGTFSVQTAFTTGDSCRSPTVVSGTFPQTITGQNFVGYRKDINNFASTLPCRDYSGPDRIYQVTIPARGGPDGGVPGRMDFSVNSTSDLVLNAYNFESSCVASPAVCLNGSDTIGGGTEALAVTNPNAVPVTIFVGVSTYSAASATYSVTVNVQ